MMYFSWDSVDQMVRFRGWLQCDGNGIAWPKSGRSLQLLLTTLQSQNCVASRRPNGLWLQFLLLYWRGSTMLLITHLFIYYQLIPSIDYQRCCCHSYRHRTR